MSRDQLEKRVIIGLSVIVLGLMGFVGSRFKLTSTIAEISQSEPNQTPQSQVLTEQETLADRQIANMRKALDIQKQYGELCKQLMDLGSQKEASQCWRDLRDISRR